VLRGGVLPARVVVDDQLAIDAVEGGAGRHRARRPCVDGVLAGEVEIDGHAARHADLPGGGVVADRREVHRGHSPAAQDGRLSGRGDGGGAEVVALIGRFDQGERGLLLVLHRDEPEPVQLLLFLDHRLDPDVRAVRNLHEPREDGEHRLAHAAGVAADFRTASFTGLDAAFGPAAAFDAVLCIGNSLTLAPTDDDVAAAWRAMHCVLRPGGIAVVHVFNWDRVVAAGLKIMPAIILDIDGRSVTTLRVFHHHASVIDLHLVTVSRSDDGRAETQVLTAAQRPLGPDRLAGMAAAAGFEEAARWNGYDGRPFDPDRSDQLLLVARKPSPSA